ncbi:MAG TPA: bifunctional methylenetetrahydrofolate dehydrogenase/methenyltetrahydrofolate cyclohydrolase FolD [Ignavibacteriales bacterium]|jgi:methylenetetrahydrofolate dehydrogenase (NADP+)/methenyltetrahydrofolate cyclohydrolase|nr:bifunctional methylenetetrahydrofolate dehydrogenase/methenyltetrahydrofolate cyclohydrolase FolD [Ignavibacteriales bacterium]
MKILDGKLVSQTIKNEIKVEVEQLKEKTGKVPGLVTILVGDNPASKVYVSSKHKACLEVGFLSVQEKLPADISESQLLEIIYNYNENPTVNGILVQLPLPKHIDENKVIEAILPQKDVDGFHPMNVGNLVIGKDCFKSCTPAGIQELLKRYNIETAGKHVVVVGRSNIVGKPIANIMLQKEKFANSIVTVCHTAAKDLSVYTKQADILIAAVGRPNVITKDMVKEGVVVIDVGINSVPDENSPKGYKLVGDVDFDSVSQIASYITPVPGGVGPMTIAMLLANTLKSFRQFNNI